MILKKRAPQTQDAPTSEQGGVDRLQAVPLYHQIFMQLKEEIVSGERALGSRLPTEQELAEHYQVSRITARRALHELAETRLVSRARRIGTTVIFQPPVKPIEGSLEQALDSLISFGRNTQVQVLEFERVQARGPISELMAVEPGTALLKAVRLRWLDAAPLSHLISYIPAGLGVKLNRTTLKSTPMLSLIKAAGIRIGGARQTISASIADAPLAQLLEVDIGSPLLRVSRTLVDMDGKPIQHVYAHFRPDRYQIRLDLHHGQV